MSIDFLVIKARAMASKECEPGALEGVPEAAPAILRFISTVFSGPDRTELEWRLVRQEFYSSVDRNLYMTKDNSGREFALHMAGG